MGETILFITTGFSYTEIAFEKNPSNINLKVYQDKDRLYN
jgi:hypothetical protein